MLYFVYKFSMMCLHNQRRM